jgi:amino-acid N-acetyltransferase
MIEDQVFIQTATESDVIPIVSILRANQDDLSLFQRSEVNIRRHLGDFVVAKGPTGEVLGCAALHKYSMGLAEILSVAVAPDAQGKRIGHRLLDACTRRAEAEGVKRLWLATLKPGYFARFGYAPMSRWELPSSVLLQKLAQVFAQPLSRWMPALAGRQVFMQRDCAHK